MIYIPLERSAKRTYTKQIYYAIRQKILSGELTAGEALPPYRELSQELGVSKNTVFSAYDMLVSDGLLRSGVYAVPVERHGQRTNELILRYAGLTKDELSLGAERLRKGIECIGP